MYPSLAVALQARLRDHVVRIAGCWVSGCAAANILQCCVPAALRGHGSGQPVCVGLQGCQGICPAQLQRLLQALQIPCRQYSTPSVAGGFASNCCRTVDVLGVYVPC